MAKIDAQKGKYEKRKHAFYSKIDNYFHKKLQKVFKSFEIQAEKHQVYIQKNFKINFSKLFKE